MTDDTCAGEEGPPDEASQAAVRAGVQRAIRRQRRAVIMAVALLVVVVGLAVWLQQPSALGALPVLLAVLWPLLGPALVGPRRLRAWLEDGCTWERLEATNGVIEKRAGGPRLLLRDASGQIAYLSRVPLPGIARIRLSYVDWTPVWVCEHDGTFAIVRDDRAVMATSVRGLRSP